MITTCMIQPAMNTMNPRFTAVLACTQLTQVLPGAGVCCLTSTMSATHQTGRAETQTSVHPSTHVHVQRDDKHKHMQHAKPEEAAGCNCSSHLLATTQQPTCPKDANDGAMHTMTFGKFVTSSDHYCENGTKFQEREEDRNQHIQKLKQLLRAVVPNEVSQAWGTSGP